MMTFMTLLVAARCENCGRDVHELPEARQEGESWFCAQSCYLQQQSRLPRLDVPAAAPAQVRSQGAPSPLRVAWKTIKVLVTFVMLAVTALVIGFVAAVVKVQRD